MRKREARSAVFKVSQIQTRESQIQMQVLKVDSLVKNTEAGNKRMKFHSHTGQMVVIRHVSVRRVEL